MEQLSKRGEVVKFRSAAKQTSRRVRGPTLQQVVDPNQQQLSAQR